MRVSTCRYPRDFYFRSSGLTIQPIITTGTRIDPPTQRVTKITSVKEKTCLPREIRVVAHNTMYQERECQSLACETGVLRSTLTLTWAMSKLIRKACLRDNTGLKVTGSKFPFTPVHDGLHPHVLVPPQLRPRYAPRRRSVRRARRRRVDQGKCCIRLPRRRTAAAPWRPFILRVSNNDTLLGNTHYAVCVVTSCGWLFARVHCL